MKEIIKKCLRDYFDVSGITPRRIIYLRDGINPSGRNNFIINELPMILQAPREIQAEYEPEIAVCMIDRKPTQKFFV